MTMLTRDAILNADDLPTEEVEVPEWGGTVLVGTMTGTERDAFETAVQRNQGTSGKTDLAGLKAWLALLTVRDTDGKRLFDEADIIMLQSKSGAAIDRIFQVASRLNHLLARDVEELAGNLPATAGGPSGSA